MAKIKEYEVTNPMGVTFKSGTLKLTKKQAFRRRNHLKSLGDDCYEVFSAVMFKNGERLGYDGVVSKALLSEVGEVIKKPQEGPGPSNNPTTTDGNPPEGGQTIDLDKLSNKELKKEMDARKIKHNSLLKNDKRETMIQKILDYEKAQKGPEGE